jgi:hypothetical protein
MRTLPSHILTTRFTGGHVTPAAPMIISSGSSGRRPKPNRSKTSLHEELKLELSATKTLITHARE